MQVTPRDARAHADEHPRSADDTAADPGRCDRAEDEAAARAGRRRHIAATQMAAPSTRRWRRAGSFGSPS